jgi:hypothetical protein
MKSQKFIIPNSFLMNKYIFLYHNILFNSVKDMLINVIYYSIVGILIILSDS